MLAAACKTERAASCAADGECGGGGFVCAAVPGGAGHCCKPNGKETCDGVDNDCNGKVDDGFPAEICNGVDDNCDGKIDEPFNLMTDAFHCGQCNRGCGVGQICSAGVCRLAGEPSCMDGTDEDGDGKTDCEDPDCNLKRCGTGCECRAGKKAEGNCTNGADDDGDGKSDCLDEDCAGAGCGVDGGCTCAGLMKKETDCRDAFDNDGDAVVDCADGDCGAQLCQAAPSTYRCAGVACGCNADAGVRAEADPAVCRDGIDNDCDGLVDCAEGTCNFLSCSPDGGFACRCLFGGKAELDCADRRDNDDDGTTDCGDSLPDGGGDCPVTTPCSYLDGNGAVAPGTCAADHTCK